MFDPLKKEGEQFDKVDYTFINEGDFEENVRIYVDYLKSKLGL
jgi:hypothetical protein